MLTDDCKPTRLRTLVLPLGSSKSPTAESIVSCADGWIDGWKDGQTIKTILRLGILIFNYFKKQDALITNQALGVPAFLLKKI